MPELANLKSVYPIPTSVGADYAHQLLVVPHKIFDLPALHIKIIHFKSD
jgi:hypothetical protein